MKKFLLVFLCLIISALPLSSGCFVNGNNGDPQTTVGGGNGGNGNNNGNNNGGDNGNNNGGGNGGNVVTIEEFMQNGNVARDFINTFVRGRVIGRQTVKSEGWAFKANASGELTEMQALYTVDKAGNSRSVEYSVINFIEPVGLAEIAAGGVSDILISVTTESAFVFDAKLNYDNSNLLSALVGVFVGDMNACDIVAYDKLDNGKYAVAYRDGSGFNVKSVMVNSNLSDTEAIAAIKDGMLAYSDIDYFALSTAYINIKGYTPESGLKDEAETPGNEGGEHGNEGGQGGEQKEETPISSISELATTYSAEMKQALNGAFKDKIYAKSFEFLSNLDEKNIMESTWDIGNSNEISEIKLMTTYHNTNGNIIINVGKVSLKQSINVSDLTKENLNQKFSEVKFSTSSLYDFSYNPSIQQQKSDVMNAIFDEMGMGLKKEDDAIRLVKFDTFQIDPELEANAGFYTVVEINKNGIIEFSINIKGDNDKECITNLSNPAKYKVYNEKTCILDGLKIINVKTE